MSTQFDFLNRKCEHHKKEIAKYSYNQLEVKKGITYIQILGLILLIPSVCLMYKRSELRLHPNQIFAAFILFEVIDL